VTDATALPDEILSFWFADSLGRGGAGWERRNVWFGSDPAFDDEVRRRFEPILERAAAGELDSWKADPRCALALITLLDQFPRNLYRGRPRAFEHDPLALGVCLHSIRVGHIAKLHPIETVFALLPLEHAEDRATQRLSVEQFSALLARAPRELCKGLEEALEAAQRHFDIVMRFGRFPHRNTVLGRESTAEELEFLRNGGATFRQ